jgi:hypothetical protein
MIFTTVSQEVLGYQENQEKDPIIWICAISMDLSVKSDIQ